MRHLSDRSLALFPASRMRAPSTGLWGWVTALCLSPLLIGCGSQPGGPTKTSTSPQEYGPGSGTEEGTEEAGIRAQGAQTPDEDVQPPVQRFEVVARYPHDPRSYTQGLVFADGRFLESTGQYGTSRLLEVRLDSGAILREVQQPYRYFSEGLALMEGELFQLTWKSGLVFVYDRRTFAKKREERIGGEGWGLATDGKHLILSDGSDVLRFLDPKTFGEVRRVSVRSGRRPVRNLNELEYIEGEVWANVWKKNLIARIDPETGRVLAWVDLTGLMDFEPPRNSDAVLNGIAYDPARKRLFVTGKLWPTLYEIRVLAD